MSGDIDIVGRIVATAARRHRTQFDVDDLKKAFLKWRLPAVQ